MGKWRISTIFLLPVLAVLVLFSAGSIHAQSELNIPDWVKSNALWWAEGTLTDQDFVNALQYLITNGIITIPGAVTEVTENEPSIDLPYDIDIKFGQPTYNSGDTAEIRIETDSPDPQNVRIGIFDSSGDIIYETTVRTNDFGTADAEFNLPEYYQSDEQLEAVAFFVRDTKDKYTASALVNGMRITELELDIDTSKILSHVPSTVKVALSNAVSKEIWIRVLDSDTNILYDDTITTNDFGVGKTEFVAPNYYLKDEPVVIVAVFADDHDAGLQKNATIDFTKVDLTITFDKIAYAIGDPITITITTNPPVSTGIRLDSDGDSDCLGDHSKEKILPVTIQTDASGAYTIEGKIYGFFCDDGIVYSDAGRWDDRSGIHIINTDKRFTPTGEFFITSK